MANNFVPVIIGKSAITGNEDSAILINGFSVSDNDNPSSLRVKVGVSHGSLALTTTTGITGTTAGASLEFEGSIANLNTALNSLTYQSNLNYSGADGLTVQVSDDNGVSWHDYLVDQPGKFYNSNNGHYYEFVNATGITWAAAKTAAESRTVYGLNGYLTTVTSQLENDFIKPKLGGIRWMGSSDAATEGDWRWVTGPEAGTQFWSGNGSGSAIGGLYNNWYSGEPNNYGAGENYGLFYQADKWADAPNNFLNYAIGYVVEYGGTGFGTLQTVPLTVTVNAVNDAPVLNNLSGDAATTTINQVVLIDIGTVVTITDVDTTNFNGGTLVITTTSGTANGSFSLDGANAASGGNNTVAAGETITVGGTTIGTVHATNDGQNGRTLTITLNSNATTTNVATLIKNIGFESATAGLRNFNLALSESDGQTANAAFSVDVQNNPMVKGRSSVAGNEDTPISITGLTVSDADNPASLTVKIAANQGSLTLGTTTGITGTTSGNSLQFSGSIANLNTALGGLSYQGNLNYSGTDDLTIQVSDDSGASWHDYFVDQVGKFYNPNNSHYYEYVSIYGIDWASAKAAAESRTLYGLNGYLATITLQSESDYITARLGGSGWFGASDAAIEGDWRWVTGPEAGTQFWSGAANGSAVNGRYSHWISGEPNDQSGEDYPNLLLNGFWNDVPGNTPGIQGYIVEYGGTGFGTLGTVPLTVTVNAVNDAPILNNLNGDAAATTVNWAVPIDTGTAVTITDGDTTNFNGGTLVITTTSGTANGSFSLDGANAASGGNHTLAAGETVTVGGTTIGTVHATNDGQNGHTLTVTLNSNATTTNVSEFIKNIGYQSATVGLRNFNLALSESDGKTTNAAFSVNVQDAPSIKGRSSVAGNEDTPISISGLTVSDANNPASLTVKIAANYGTLTLGTTAGITGTTSGSTLQFSGSIADLNTALGSLSYQGNLDYSGTDDLTIQVSDDNGVSWHDYFVDQVGKFYNPNNGHYY
ncbi:hypothetical protein C8R34_11139, partial [Nitrosomonas sp. Nm84]|uniref:hypothetical protein n=1 Tax=Nitrosomonas sp. Nm84 TaxID=200124 RepID=UPI000D96F27F